MMRREPRFIAGWSPALGVVGAEADIQLWRKGGGIGQLLHSVCDKRYGLILDVEILNAEKYSWIAQGQKAGMKGELTGPNALSWILAPWGQVRKSEGTYGVGLSGKNYRDGQFSLLLEPTASVGGEVDKARIKEFTFGFLSVRSLQVIIKGRIRLRMVVTVKIRQDWWGARSAGTASRACWAAVRTRDLCWEAAVLLSFTGFILVGARERKIWRV